MTRQSAALTRNAKNYAEKIKTRVRELNDNFRRDILNRDLGTLILTAGVAALKDEIIALLVRDVQTFEDFSEGNDPYGEHDFGALNFRDIKYFWKIDYYRPGTRFHSKNKANPKITHRVLTIMRADEY